MTRLPGPGRRNLPIPLHLLWICIFFITSGLQAQEGTSGETPQGPYKACILPNMDLSGDEENRQYQDIFTQHLVVEFENAGFEIIPRDSWQGIQQERGLSGRDLIKGPNAVALAADAGADLAVTGFYRAQGRGILLEIKCYDVARRQLITGVLKRGRLNLTVYNLIARAMDQMLPDIRLEREEEPEETGEPLVKEINLLSGDEEMAVYLAGERFAGRIQDGELSLMSRTFTVGTELLIEKRKPGYHTGREVLRLTLEEQTVTLKPLKKKTTWATEINYTVGQILGLGLAQRYYPKPDYAFLSFEHYFYVQHNFMTQSKPVFHHDLKALFGHYLFTGPDQPVRLALSAGLGCILTYYTVPGLPLQADFYLNALNFMVELNLSWWALFLRMEGKYALGLGNNVLGRRWLSVNDSFPPTTIGMVIKW